MSVSCNVASKPVTAAANEQEFAKSCHWYDVSCPSLWVCVINRSMYDVPCPSLWGLNYSNHATFMTNPGGGMN
jgi:hypothetical protein